MQRPEGKYPDVPGQGWPTGSLNASVKLRKPLLWTLTTQGLRAWSVPGLFSVSQRLSPPSGTQDRSTEQMSWLWIALRLCFYEIRLPHLCADRNRVLEEKADTLKPHDDAVDAWGWSLRVMHSAQPVWACEPTPANVIVSAEGASEDDENDCFPGVCTDKRPLTYLFELKKNASFFSKRN